MELIEGLEETKRIATDIEARSALAKETQVEIGRERQTLVSVAMCAMTAVLRGRRILHCCNGFSGNSDHAGAGRCAQALLSRMLLSCTTTFDTKTCHTFFLLRDPLCSCCDIPQNRKAHGPRYCLIETLRALRRLCPTNV